ncbi:unnamed protein product [Rotaria magnacalcarata]|uniref:Uncharacterized protein n=1 Tax=Rotaria magnacalcarata TaxID=392030 RepID=A0A816U544_9BILA|nr:unnamed protein product [Rotaria magnacalcarata]
MSDRTNDENSTSSASLDEATTDTSEMVLDEINHTTHDQDPITRALGDTNGFNLIEEPEIFIQPGNSQPYQDVASSLVVVNFIVENQPRELERNHDSSISSAIIDNEPDMTTLIQNANTYDNTASPINLYNAHDTLPVADALFINYVIIFTYKKLPDVFVPLDIQIQILTESNGVETAESPAQVEPNNGDIRNSRLEPIVVIDLTEDEVSELQSSAVVPPVLIDLTQDDNEEEVQQTSHVLADENMNPSQNDPVADSAPIIEAPDRSMEVIDENLTIASVAVPSNETIDNRAQVSTTMLLPRAHKRSMSSIEKRQVDKNRTSERIKRCRKSTS